MSLVMRIAIIAVGMSALPLGAVAQNRAVRGQAELAADFRSGDRGRVAEAVGQLPIRHDPEDPLRWVFPLGYRVTRELADALILALDREARLYLDSGGPATHLELDFELMHAVIALRDVASVPALLQMVGTGGGARNALLSFGPDVVIPPLLDLAMSPEWVEPSGPLYALAGAVERWGPTLDADTRARIKAAADLHLNEAPGGMSSLHGAIWLASHLRDPDLLSVLGDMARSDEGILKRGIGPYFVEGIRKSAAEALAAPLKSRRPPPDSI